MVAKRNQSVALTRNSIPRLFAALDVGNGGVSGVSTEVREPLTFEPVIAPLTTGRGLSHEEELPTWSLKTDDGTLVFGLDDVRLHGQHDAMRRQYGMDRYTSDDYFNLVNVMLLHLFASWRGQDERISPTLAINLPVEQFNKREIVDQVIDRLSGQHNILDHEGCLLQMSIDPRKINVMPESSGALMHYAFSPELQRRGDTSGTTLVIDIGFETTDGTMFEGMKYQRDRARTFKRTGMGNVSRFVQQEAGSKIRDVDMTEVDHKLRALPTLSQSSEMLIELNGRTFDVGKAYRHAIKVEAAKIADAVVSTYQGDVSRVVLAGGGAYHLQARLRDLLPFEKVCMVNQPEFANVIGAYTTLQFQAQRDAR